MSGFPRFGCSPYLPHKPKPKPYNPADLLRVPENCPVVDGTHHRVRLEHLNGSTGQLWTFHRVRRDEYYIVNVQNGRILEIEEGGDSNGMLVIGTGIEALHQLWFSRPQAVFYNRYCTRLLLIHRGRYVAGNHFTAVPYSRNPSRYVLYFKSNKGFVGFEPNLAKPVR